MQTFQDEKSSLIGNHTISLRKNSNLLLMITDGNIIKLTPTEYTLVECLLDGKVIQDEFLVFTLFGIREKLDKAMLTNLVKHINNTRSKLRPFSLNLYRVNRYGYVLSEIPPKIPKKQKKK